MERFLKSRYRIGDQLSDNPFSATYKGSFISTNKPVVIKIYKRGTLNSRLINQMKQKVRELSAISYHGVAKLIDGDYGWQGFYYVREYIDGHSLEQILKSRGKLDLDKAVVITSEICQALTATHAKAIIHGGLKPSNVFIDSQGIVKVSDFIIEGEIKEAMPQKALLLMEDGRYCAPEELTGSPAGISSDLYALGLVMLEMVAPEALFKEVGLAASVKKLRSLEPYLPYKLSQLPRYFQEIINKTLQPDTLKRFASAEEVRQSLENQRLTVKQSRPDELVDIFDNTVIKYGEPEEDSKKEIEALDKTEKEQSRMWQLVVALILAVLSGLAYAFWFVR